MINVNILGIFFTKILLFKNVNTRIIRFIQHVLIIFLFILLGLHLLFELSYLDDFLRNKRTFLIILAPTISKIIAHSPPILLSLF